MDIKKSLPTKVEQVQEANARKLKVKKWLNSVDK